MEQGGERDAQPLKEAGCAGWSEAQRTCPCVTYGLGGSCGGPCGQASGLAEGASSCCRPDWPADWGWIGPDSQGVMMGASLGCWTMVAPETSDLSAGQVASSSSGSQV